MQEVISVREITMDDVALIVDYWKKSEASFLVSMGVDLLKIPSEGDLRAGIQDQLFRDYPSKKSYAVIWLIKIGRAHV